MRDKVKHKEAINRWKKENPDRVKEQDKKAAVKYYKRNPNVKRHNALKNKYGITFDEYLAMVEAQHGRCEICGKEAKLQVDHCHQTGKIRGLLCMNCNTGIGNLRDSAELLEKAINYLTR